MRRRLILVTVLVWAGSGIDVLACGNKFLVPSRGTRFGKVPPARQEARILVYAPPNSSLSQALGDIPVTTILAGVGYQPTEVSGPEELDTALRQGSWDLVLADTTSLPEPLQGTDAPAILPVLHKPSRTEVAEARQTYGEVIRSPSKSQRFIETVDSAVARRTTRHSTATGAAAAP
jgi:hypothetical protein